MRGGALDLASRHLAPQIDAKPRPDSENRPTKSEGYNAGFRRLRRQGVPFHCQNAFVLRVFFARISFFIACYRQSVPFHCQNACVLRVSFGCIPFLRGRNAAPRVFRRLAQRRR